MKLKDFLRNIKFETILWVTSSMLSVDRTADVHRCRFVFGYIMAAGHSGICRRTADILVGLFI